MRLERNPTRHQLPIARHRLAPMEINVNAILEQRLLLDHLIAGASRCASTMLDDPDTAAQLRTPSDCGLTPIERFEYSALAEDQLLAAALRLTAAPAEPAAIEVALRGLFETPASRVAIEAQRRAAFGPFASQGLPIERAWETAAEIGKRAKREELEPFRNLLTYADLYSDLWCDPRIAAPVAARREMLALVGVLSALAMPERAEPLQGAGS